MCCQSHIIWFPYKTFTNPFCNLVYSQASCWLPLQHFLRLFSYQLYYKFDATGLQSKNIYMYIQKGDRHLEDLGVRSSWPKPVCRDDASLERAVTVTACKAILTLWVGGSRQQVTEDTHSGSWREYVEYTWLYRQRLRFSRGWKQALT